jgi:hypothetical protein
MGDRGSRETDASPRRAVRTIAIVTVVALLVLVPGVVLVLSAVPNAPVSKEGGLSGLDPAWHPLPITFIEKGLVIPTLWKVDLNGTTRNTTGTQITFSEVPGSYPFSVPPVPGYTASPTSGVVKLTSCMATVYITFTPIVRAGYTISFNETGLPSGTAWWVNLNGTNTSGSGSSITFSARNGTYPFTLASNIPGGTGTQYNTSVTPGTVTVNGANVTVKVPYVTEYYLTMIASPPAGGSVTPSSGWYGSGALVSISETNSSGYAFLDWNGSGTGNYTGTDGSASVTMNSPIVENATFGASYEVQFERQGLPDAVEWTVSLTGATGTQSQTGYFVFLDFYVPNGTYTYVVTPIPGYHADSYAGTVTVAGSDVTVVISWVRVTYDVTFQESGLPSGTSWTVTLNGSSQDASAPGTIVFVDPNGSLPWSVAAISGYTPSVTGGTVVINGANVVVDITWTPSSQPARTTFTVTFVETGLPTGTSWSASLNGTGSPALSSTSTTIVFSGVPNGKYTYWIPNAANYQPSTSAGPVVVSGQNVTVDVSFSAIAPATHPTTTTGISLWDWLIIAFIAAGAIVSTYLIYRRR